MTPVIIIAGATASGKSKLALELALTKNGTIINADSVQLYKGIEIISAQPSAADHSLCPHKLYGTQDPATPATASDWQALALAEIHAAHAEGRLPIVVGGTGFYLMTLIKGLHPVPPIDTAVRTELQRRLQTEGLAALAQTLTQIDPIAAAKIHPNDTHRVLRALEVFYGTNRTLTDWRTCEQDSPPSFDFETILVDPDRETLNQNANLRLDQMIEMGAIDEVRHLQTLNLPQHSPALHALGVKELMAYLDGTLTLEEAVTRAKIATHQYIKRQRTWFRHQFKAQQVTRDVLNTPHKPPMW